jgi:hypothetical protein
MPLHDQVREILNSERPDMIWSQSGWSADGLKSLGIPIICTIHDRSAFDRLSSLTFAHPDVNLL